MRKRRGGSEDESEVNLTPMLDVVFIMLIFFIVTASFVKESGIDVHREKGEYLSGLHGCLTGACERNRRWKLEERRSASAVTASRLRGS